MSQSGQLMVGIAGLELSAEECHLLRHPQIAGVILFSRNYQDPEQLAALTNSIHRLRDPALLIAVDQEGGRVQRFRDGFTRLPPMAALGRLYDVDPAAAREQSYALGWLMAAELRALGVDFSFAPVVDLARGVSSVIGDRGFHALPAVVSELAACWIDGMREAGMPATAKHFPGHGSVAPDSHLELPVDTRPEPSLRDSDLLPFESLIRQQRVDAIMTAHVAYPKADNQPASFSRYWIGTVLRDDLGFDGVVVADDLDMEGAAALGDRPGRARVALEAGNDLLLLCNSLDARESVLAAMPSQPDPAASRRIAAMRRPFDTRTLAQVRQDPRARTALQACRELLPDD
ncbi:beta-N-acetylhexosaminidase [Methylonatrum kenyense]|uniref:beta-N-acetylhexosaminidase n=1 Tax=Methylonatrum kenyense TaxID=455253 RepID=UPI0020C183AA|nr:beta-N-acetylhexosaminidase [Methylonatrum kenyense]MCK8515695.1 beta-N-acetylhexosaminidase [Methylonatrum kenyense]